MSHFIFIDNFYPVDTKVIINLYANKKNPKISGIIYLENEIHPSDLYCYLYAKYGQPNGFQNLLRNDDSDNLIHWEWTLESNEGWVSFLGMNFRTEVVFFEEFDIGKISKNQLINSIKNDFKNYGEKISNIKKNILEDWDLSINPYYEIKSALNQLIMQFDGLQLDSQNEKIDYSNLPFQTVDVDLLKEVGSRYSFGIGLSLSIRFIVPILAESFINFLIFILCDSEIKNNERIYEKIIRENMDIKIQMLHKNCDHFARPVKWDSVECKNYNSIINTRNNLLHGNVDLKKLKFDEVYFNGKIPIFKKYNTMWQRSLGVKIDSCGMEKVKSDIEVVNKFIEHVISCLDEKIRKEIDFIMDSPEFGINKKTNKLGILFPNHLVDFHIPKIAIK